QTGADRLSLGGAIAANVHGRGLTMKPFVGDVESFVLVDANGDALECSREQNRELFELVIGGYGLFGIVYSVRLRLARRQKLVRRVEVRSVTGLIEAFDRRVDEGFEFGDFQFAIDAESSDFLNRGVFSCYRPVAIDTPIPKSTKTLRSEQWEQLLHLAHVDKSEAFRRYSAHYLATDGQVYWSDRHQMGIYLDGYHTRLDARLGACAKGTEVITEVYVPRSRLEGFLREARRELRELDADVIYGTIRLIERDDESFLPWAREAFACMVLNLHTEHTPEGIDRAATMFRSLIDVALSFGGTFYLTYHRFATRDQIETAYPEFREFLREKKRRDPNGVFRSDWHDHYRHLFDDSATRT
ncbi:MAG: D-arabinono-1,4-lactone oxidase, partial [Planctomycetota bacterium]